MPSEEAPKQIQLLVRIPPKLKKMIRIEAAEEERSMSQIVTSALQFYFKAPKGQGPRKRRD